MNIKTWLLKEIQINRQMPDGRIFNQKTTALKRFSELIAVNQGDFVVNQFGRVMGHPQAPYGRFGLTLQEAMELTSYNGIFTGLELAFGAVQRDEAVELIKAEVERIKKVGFNPLEDAVEINPATGSAEPRIEIYDESAIKTMIEVDKKIRGRL